jgi:acyl-CoA reductase-like NAD-dependent aldehyde dehydrogenase
LATSSNSPFAVLVAGARRQEVARIGQAVRADGPEVRQAQQRAEVLADIAARLAVRQADLEAHAARDHRDFLRFDFEQAQFGGDAQAP